MLYNKPKELKMLFKKHQGQYNYLGLSNTHLMNLFKFITNTLGDLCEFYHATHSNSGDKIFNKTVLLLQFSEQGNEGMVLVKGGIKKLFSKRATASNQAREAISVAEIDGLKSRILLLGSMCHPELIEARAGEIASILCPERTTPLTQNISKGILMIIPEYLTWLHCNNKRYLERRETSQYPSIFHKATHSSASNHHSVESKQRERRTTIATTGNGGNHESTAILEEGCPEDSCFTS